MKILFNFNNTNEKKKTRENKINITTVAAASVLMGSINTIIPGIAYAQIGASSPSEGIESIIVTAQKREESLQSTPLSISVLDSHVLEQRGIKAVTDLFGGVIPAVRIAPFVGRSSAITIGMRGLVPTDATQISRDPAVGIYIDGIYLGRVQGLGTELVDVERIEVLRGPQGTLFGRNAMGGALSIITKKPSGMFDADITAGVRNWNGRNIAAHVNLPKIENLSIKLDGVYNKRDGWIKNPLSHASDWNEIYRYGFRVAALWEPSENFSAQYSYDHSTDKSTGGYPFVERAKSGLAPMFRIDGKRRSTARAGFILDPSLGKVKGHALHAELDISDSLTIRSITSYRKLDQDQNDNSAGIMMPFSPNGLEGRLSMANVTQSQLSQEIQFVASLDRLKYVAGVFYYNEKATDNAFAPFTARFNETGTEITTLSVPVSATPFPDRASKVDAESKALFGQGTWTPAIIDDRLHLTLGLRYTSDNKNGRLTKQRGTNAPAYMKFNFNSKRVDPAVTIAFDINDEVNSYLRWSTGYRSGGANSRSATFRTFDEETVSSWEMGLKSELLDRRMRLNLAAYYSQLKDMQVDFPLPSNHSVTETTNGSKDAKIKGLEVDLTVLPGAGFAINSNYSYTITNFQPQINPFADGLFEVVRAAQTPKHAISVALDYKRSLSSFGTFLGHLDVNWSSGFYSAATDTTLSKKVILVNGRLSLTDVSVGGKNMEISLWSKNITNAEYQLFDYGSTYFNEPRSYGVDVKILF